MATPHRNTHAERAAARLDLLAATHTAFRSFDGAATGLLNAKGDYSPSLRTRSAHSEEHRRELTELADAYDAIQQKRGDSRRACRS